MTPDPAQFLAPSDAIDFQTPEVTALASRLSTGDTTATAKRCFEFVRDEIKHSCDFKLNPVTYSASAVLAHSTGYCYAKSHLLCALLRANKIPAGLCYQRLSIDDRGAPYCLHGLNAVFLPAHGWYRIDARGNRDNIDAQFNPPIEQLAFSASLPAEYDLPGIFAAPLEVVTSALTTHKKWDGLLQNLPDAEPATTNSIDLN